MLGIGKRDEKISPLRVDIDTIMRWLQKYAHGHKNAKKKHEILRCIKPLLTTKTTDIERYFRRITESLRKQGHVSSTPDLGYWFNPVSLHSLPPDERRAEIDAQLHSLRDKKSRAMELLDGISKQMYSLEEERKTITVQHDFFNAGVA